MSIRTPIKSRTVKVSFTVQEAVDLQNLLVIAISSLDGGEKRYSVPREKLKKSIDETISKAMEEDI